MVANGEAWHRGLMHIDSDRDRRPTSWLASVRERRLWMLAGLLVATIYSTLGLASRLAGSIEQGIFDALFVVGFGLAVTAIAVIGWRYRPGGAEIGVALAVVAAYLMVLARIGTPAERTHLFEYSLVAVLIHQALEERRSHGRRVPVPGVMAVLLTVCLGWIDEAIQLVLPGRVYDLRDVGFNALAAVLAVAASVVLARLRRTTRSRVAR